MADRTYRAAPPDALRVEPLGDLTLIFDRRSTQTHIVVSPMLEILAAMGADGCNAAAVAARLAAAFDLGDADGAQALVAERLVELAELGLVAPV